MGKTRKPVHGHSSLEANSLRGPVRGVDFLLSLDHVPPLKSSRTSVQVPPTRCAPPGITAPWLCLTLPHKPLGTAYVMCSGLVHSNPSISLQGSWSSLSPPFTSRHRDWLWATNLPKETQLLTSPYAPHSTTPAENQCWSRSFHHVTRPVYLQCSPPWSRSGSHFPTWHLRASNFPPQSSVSAL